MSHYDCEKTSFSRTMPLCLMPLYRIVYPVQELGKQTCYQDHQTSHVIRVPTILTVLSAMTLRNPDACQVWSCVSLCLPGVPHPLPPALWKGSFSGCFTGKFHHVSRNLLVGHHLAHSKLAIGISICWTLKNILGDQHYHILIIYIFQYLCWIVIFMGLCMIWWFMAYIPNFNQCSWIMVYLDSISPPFMAQAPQRGNRAWSPWFDPWAPREGRNKKETATTMGRTAEC